jgi:hypothetical protein
VKPVPPARRDDQRREALLKANEVRLRHSRVKAQLKNREVSLETLLRQGADGPAPRMRIEDAIRAVPGLGPVKAPYVLAVTRINPRRSLEALTERQVRELLETIAHRL